MHLSAFAFSLPILIGIEITVVHLWKISVHVENWFISFSLPTMINLLYDLSLYYCFHPFSIVMYSILLGDFGEENLEVIKSVVNLEFAKAVILGNHDAWFTKQFFCFCCWYAYIMLWVKQLFHEFIKIKWTIFS